MPHPSSLCAVAVALLAALPSAHGAIYTKKSPVLQVTAKDYERLIAKSNYTSIVEFYAPWCGHCQNLKPAYEKAATKLNGLAKVAAIDCDDDVNKSLCGQMGVKGFPTLKIVRPRKGGGKPTVEDYQGQRTATGIVDAVVNSINTHVKRVTDKDVDAFLSEKNETAKALFFTDKGTTSALVKSIAIDFLDVISVAQVRDNQAKAAGIFGVNKFPSLVLLPGGDKDGLVYDGELKKPAIVKFLSQAGEPNPDPAPAAAKATAKKETKGSSSSKTKKTESSSTTEAAEEVPTQQAPVIIESAQPIPAINTPEKLIKECLTEKSSTCVLAFVPSTHGDSAKEALASLSDLAFKYSKTKRHLFPIFEVAKENEAAANLIKLLDISGEVEIVALNARRAWWRQYDSSNGFGHENVEKWVDSIRMSEGVKNKLPKGIVTSSLGESSSSAAGAAEPEASSEATPAATSGVESEKATPLTPKPSETTTASAEAPAQSGADPVPEPETASERTHEEL